MPAAGCRFLMHLTVPKSSVLTALMVLDGQAAVFSPDGQQLFVPCEWNITRGVIWRVFSTSEYQRRVAILISSPPNAPPATKSDPANSSPP